MQGIAVFNYLNNNNIQALIGDIHNGVRDDFSEFDEIFNDFIVPALGYGRTNTRDLWTFFINALAQRMANVHQIYVNGRLDQLETGWNDVLDNNPTLEEEALATEALHEISLLRQQVPNLIVFNRANLT